MEELIEILINLIAGFVQKQAVKPTQQRTPPVPLAIPVKQSPVATKRPVARRPGRRPPPPIIAMAQPIVTKVSTAPVAPVAPIARSIVANTGIARPNEVPPESAVSIRKWLTPATLKNQFLLTEILQPPLALRDKRC
jgi:hypothetical protein